jgi:predicted ATPase/DNA-binding SARP family transcriptional activator
LVCQIQLFGHLRAEVEGRIITRFRTQRTALLLAYLAYYRERVHTREAVIELLWPDADEKDARHNLSNALSSLRRQLEPPGVPAGSVVRADRTRLELNPEAVTTDVDRFQGALRAARRARGEDERRHHLLEAVRESQEELLAGLYEDWILAERERQAADYVAALQELAELLWRQGSVEQAIHHARRAVAAAPLDEEAHQQLIRFLAAAGRSSGALRQGQELTRLLEEELGEPPTAATRALLQEIERSPNAAGPPGGFAAGPPRSLGPPPPRAYAPAEAGTLTFLRIDLKTRADEVCGRLTSEPGEVGDTETDLPQGATLRERLRALAERCRGWALQEEPAAEAFLFSRVGEALGCAVELRRALRRALPEVELPPIALHTGDVELAAEPSGGLVRQHADRLLAVVREGQILCTEQVAVLARTDANARVALTSLGRFRLPGAAAPERVYQVETVEDPLLRQELPPRAERAAPSNLPRALTRFFGREQELEALRRRLLDPEVRIVTLAGAGGCGKTRLALEAAHALEEPLHGAVWWVSLAEVPSASGIPDAIADALRLPVAPGSDALTEAIEALRHSPHLDPFPAPALLVLDSFEPLIPDGVAIVRALLEGAPLLTCLVTSQRPLQFAGECLVPVPPLPTPAQPAPLDELAQVPSVRLFLDRAQAVKPDFQVTAHNAATVAELCCRLQGYPLALELAAARALALTPGQMLRYLEERLDVLATARRDITPRHRSVRATLDWSYQLLPAPLKRFLAALSVFRGGWTLEAAEAVAGTALHPDGAGLRGEGYRSAVLEATADLTLSSLIGESGTGDEPERRFHMPELQRQFAAEQLAPEEREAAEARHAQYFLALAERAGPELRQAALSGWLERLESERANIAGVLRWCGRAPERVEQGLRLGAALFPFWNQRGHSQEGEEALAALLAASPPGVPAPVRARALLAAGALALARGEVLRASAWLEESVALGRGAGIPHDLACALLYLAAAALQAGDRTPARRHGVEAEALLRTLGDRRGLAWALSIQGEAAGPDGEAAAVALLEESASLYRELEDRSGVALTLSHLGTLRQAQGALPAAEASLRHSLALYRELSHTPGIARGLASLGKVALGRARWTEAAALFRESLGHWRRLGNQRGVGEGLTGLAQALAHSEPERSIRLFAAADGLLRKVAASLPPIDQAARDERLAQLRRDLGEAEFATAWTVGCSLLPEQMFRESEVSI